MSTQIAYREYGEGTLPLVLLHGAYLSHAQWRPQVSQLGESYRIIAPDLRGHGQSSRSGQPFTMRQFASDIAALLMHLELPPSLVCGHSLGGMVAQQLALDHPGLVRGLILAESSYGTRTSRIEALLTDMATPLLLLTPVKLQARLYRQQYARHDTQMAAYLQESIGSYHDDPESYRAIWRAVISFSSIERLAAIGCPALILVGEQNRQTHTQAERMAQLIRGAQLRSIPKAGHMLNWDNSLAFNNAVLAFAARL